jgi:hypothetical protein
VTSSAEILTEWKARIEALVPAAVVGVNDRYQVQIGLRHTYLGSRAVLLSCNPGHRVFPAVSCADWEMVALVEVWYIDAQGAYIRAVEDAEQICADLYDWLQSAGGQTLGLLKIEPDLATINGADNELSVSRQVRFTFAGVG